MRSDTLSILGLYQYDNTVFDLLTLPQGLDKNTLIQSICGECAELELLYPNPEVLKALIGVWSVGSQKEWSSLLESMNFEYNPIDNYDRTETRTLSSQGTGTGQDGGSDQFSDTKTHAANNSNSSTKGNTSSSLEKTAAFNSTSLVDKGQVSGTDNDTFSGTDTEQATDTDAAVTTYGKTKSETFSKTDTETIRAHGNIGVTTVMQMIKEFRDISKFNIYDILTEEFKLRFCLGVY